MGRFRVEVDPRRCEGKKDCLRVCPANVFAMRPAPDDLPFFVRLKVKVHGGRQAYPRNEADCTGCLRCVEACPEDAVRVTPWPTPS